MRFYSLAILSANIQQLQIGISIKYIKCLARLFGWQDCQLGVCAGLPHLSLIECRTNGHILHLQSSTTIYSAIKARREMI